MKKVVPERWISAAVLLSKLKGRQQQPWKSGCEVSASIMTKGLGLIASGVAKGARSNPAVAVDMMRKPCHLCILCREKQDHHLPLKA